MNVLVIKLTSMGDVIHTLPALTDALNYYQDITFDFVVEESFQEIPAWHLGVNQVIAVATRRWRKSLWSSKQEMVAACKKIKRKRYDVVIDAQGLIKSSVIARCAKGMRHGYDKHSIREPLATRLYQRGHSVSQDQHAISRIRHLFAHALEYENQLNESEPPLDYGLSLERIPFNKNILVDTARPTMVFLHGTTWLAKEWPTANWQQLAEQLTKSYRVLLPWGNQVEFDRAKEIAQDNVNVTVLPRLDISSLAHILAGAKGVVGVDTGLGHLSAALGTPTVSIYGPTDVDLIGTFGEKQAHICAVNQPDWRTIKKNEAFDYDKVSVQSVYEQLLNLCE